MNYQPRYRRLILLAVTLLSATVFTISCSKKEDAAARTKSGRSMPRFAVEVASVQSRDAEFSVSAVGSVDAFEIVQVTARVSGTVEQVRFKEGDIVRAGDPLVEIEPERYQLAVKSAEAALEKAKASRRETQSGLARRVDIDAKNPGYISPEEIDDWRTRALSADADSTGAASELELARLNLRDAHVPAPVSGAIQTRTIQTGQYVPSGTVIATVVRRDPLLLRFTVPELDAMRIHKGMTAMFHVRGAEEDYSARITSVAEAADSSTRLVRITAEVIDPRRGELRPGSFAEVTVNLGERTTLPVIPQTAIRPSEKGFVGYVVEDSTAKEVILTLGSRSLDGMVEVRSGLEGGERIVVRGAEALRDGVLIRIISSDSAADSIRRSG